MRVAVLMLCSLCLCQGNQQKNEVNQTILDVPSSGLQNTSATIQPTAEEEKENDRKLMEEWTKMFFSMGRIERQGAQMLIFPGLFNSSTEVASPRELRSFDGKPIGLSDNFTLPTYTVEGHNTTQIFEHVASSTNNDSTPGLIQLSNDYRQFVYDEEYYFDVVESMDEDQRQRRRLRSAHINLLNADEEHISTMITSVFSTARNYITNQTVRSNVVRYLTQKMRSFGLVTGHQVFHPKEFEPMFEGNPTPNGTNVIGILPGELWGTKDDEVLVIGAHWDTVPNSGGMDDNGSGVTAILEVARAMTEGGCRPKHSIIFVAFDLEEVGCLGSIFFVRDFLIEQVLKPHSAKLKGAFILDTIMNYNNTEESQTLSPEWQKALPDFWKDLEAENKTGDFLAVLYRRDIDAPLAEVFASNWKGDGKQRQKKNPVVSSASRVTRKFRIDNQEITIMKTDKPVETFKSTKSKYRMKKVRMDLEAEVGEKLENLTDWIDLLRSDHSIEAYPHSIPAVLLTDTAPYRGVMQDCYHQECDSSSANNMLKFADIKFLTKTCQTLIDSMVSLSDSKCLFQFQPEESVSRRPGSKKSSSYTSESRQIQSSFLLIVFGIILTITR